MCETNGLSLGKKLHETSKALACQNSLSFFLLIGSLFGSSLTWTKNLNSVEIQKYDTARKLIFSRIASLVSSTSKP